MEGNESISLITKYIAAWFWQVISIMFLIASLFLFAISANLIGDAMYVAFFLVFIICQFYSFKRRQEFYLEFENEE